MTTLKPVMLLVVKTEEHDNSQFKNYTRFFETVEQAKKRANELVAPNNDFAIFTMYESGHIPAIEWKINASPVANMLENVKYEAKTNGAADTSESTKRARKRWSDREVRLLAESVADGWAHKDIAELLNRSRQAIQLKISKLKRLGML